MAEKHMLLNSFISDFQKHIALTLLAVFKDVI